MFAYGKQAKLTADESALKWIRLKLAKPFQLYDILLIFS